MANTKWWFQGAAILVFALSGCDSLPDAFGPHDEIRGSGPDGTLVVENRRSTPVRHIAVYDCPYDGEASPVVSDGVYLDAGYSWTRDLPPKCYVVRWSFGPGSFPGTREVSLRAGRVVEIIVQ